MFKPLPFPDHQNVRDPLWQRLWATYSDVITLLRADSIPTDIEMCGSEWYIAAQLPGGYSLSIRSSEEHGSAALPLDRGQLWAWHVTLHGPGENDAEVIYDSARGDQARGGTAVLPLMAHLVPHIEAARRSTLRPKEATDAPPPATGPALPADTGRD
ncbi:hypothetical protein ACFC0K_15955 [Streptomyces hydrogenans]|uniref:hypothetical protein n=1 Tax=Streptomyces hydrogenans TaxID=1873719 RepID=UPI0035DD43E9